MKKYKYPNEIYSVGYDGNMDIFQIQPIKINHGYVYYKTHSSNFLVVVESYLDEEDFKKQISIDRCYLTKQEALEHENIL